MRVIVAGSDDWRYPSVVRQALEAMAHQNRLQGTGQLVIVHMDPRRGAARLADQWAMTRAQSSPVTRVATPERRVPDWSAPCRPQCMPDHRRAGKNRSEICCPSAGFYRIDDMIRDGADWALFFTTDTPPSPWLEYLTRRVKDVGIPQVNFRP